MKIVDLTYLESISEGNKDFMKEMMDMFMEQVPEFHDAFQKSYDQKDFSALARLAHKAKSSLLMIGMNELAKETKEFEENVKSGKFTDQYQVFINKFITKSNLAIKELEEIIKNI